MKKIVVMLLLTLMLTGCEYLPSGNTEYDSIGSLLPCETDPTLFYDRSTRIVYYILGESSGYQGYGYMSPYISKNGCFCRYIDGEIVEVSNNAEE